MIRWRERIGLSKGRWSRSHGGVRAALAATIVILSGLTLLQLIGPPANAGQRDQPIRGLANRPTPAGPVIDTVDWTSMVQRRRLFQPAVPLPTRRTAHQSVERIRSQLSLHAIMQRNGDPVAYIRVKGAGLRRFAVGSGIEDMFRVLRIGRNSAEIEIVGERVQLALR